MEVKVSEQEGRRVHMVEPYQGWLSLYTRDNRMILEHIKPNPTDDQHSTSPHEMDLRQKPKQNNKDPISPPLSQIFQH
eukprot:UN03358